MIRKTNALRWSVALGATLLSFLPGHAEPVLKIQYNERPPYQVTAANGAVSGLTASPVEKALRDAGIAHEWEKIPANRQVATIKANTEALCGVGWFLTPERQQFAKFSRPIYIDKPTVLFTTPAFAAGLGPRASLEEILNLPSVRVLLKESYSYGPYIDGLLARTLPLRVLTTAENAQMVGMVRLDRADFMFVSEEEAPIAATEAGLSAADWRIYRPAGMPAGEKRHLMCSQSVSDELLRRFNQALAAVPARP